MTVNGVVTVQCHVAILCGSHVVRDQNFSCNAEFLAELLNLPIFMEFLYFFAEFCATLCLSLIHI